MNTERAAYRAEDDEGDDNGAVSFGSGPAFRPVPRIPRVEVTPPPPQAEKPPIRAGVLFERSAQIHHAEAAKASSEEDEKKKKREEDDEKAAMAQVQSGAPAATTPRKLAPKPAIPGEGLPHAAAATETSVDVLDTKDESEPKPLGHLPDLGDFMPDLPEEPVLIPSPRPPVERVRPQMAENEPVVQMNPTEAAATAEWPPDGPDANEPPAAPVPPRQSPDYASYNTATFETPSSNTSEDDDPHALNPTAAAAAGSGGAGRGSAGGGGGTPPVPPRPHGGVGASGGGGGLPPNSPNYQYKYYSAGGGGGGYNPNSYSASSPNQHGMTPGIERPQQVVINKKGSLWPYVAVLAENIARKRADRKLKKELSGRMDQQDKAQTETNTNQMRLERQQRDMLDQQRRQAIREAHRPSGHEWGVPRYASSETSVSSNGRVTGPGERPVSVAAAAAAGMRPEGAPPAPVPGQEQMNAEMPPQDQPAGQVHERHSAWHTYYEDETGRQVAGVEYGQGFKGEQKEIGKTHTGDSVAAGLAGAAGAAHAMGGGRRPAGGGGGMSGAGSSGGGGASSGPSGQGYGQQTNQYQPSLPSGMTSPGLPQGAPTHVDPQHQLPEHTKKSNAGVPGPLFWLMMVLIVVAFFAAAMI